MLSLAGWSLLSGAILLAFLFVVPVRISEPKVVEISSGTSIKQAAQRLAKHNIVILPELVSIPLRLQKSSVTAGSYSFQGSTSPVSVIHRLQAGRFGQKQRQVTIPEGLTRRQIANRVASATSITKQAFLQASEGAEGYLFPDTYTLLPDTSARRLVERMQENFRTQTKKLRPQLKSFPYSRQKVITMASLVAREAAEYKTRRRVAGVLWKRLEQDMPLQADATFFYLLGKASSELTQEDLATSSPYNLYENTGLPPTPIASPGLEAIKATLNPIRTDDLYYLTGDNGSFYFAETLEEHQQNKRRYLN